MADNIYLKIAGFGIVLNLGDALESTFSKKKIVDDIEKYFKGFIHGKKKISDFKIRINQEIDSDVIYKKKGKSFYFKIFNLGKEQISCSYEISFGQISYIIRYVLLWLLSKNNGFMMHGSAVSVNGKAYIFTGPSGAGKSTIMKILSKRYRGLADDSVIIKEERGEYHLYQTPIIEKEFWVDKQSKKYPLGGIFFLNKSKDYKIERSINKKEIIARLISQLFTNEDQSKRQVGKMINFIKKFDKFGVITFAKHQEKLTEFFSKNII